LVVRHKQRTLKTSKKKPRRTKDTKKRGCQKEFSYGEEKDGETMREHNPHALGRMEKQKKKIKKKESLLRRRNYAICRDCGSRERLFREGESISGVSPQNSCGDLGSGDTLPRKEGVTQMPSPRKESQRKNRKKRGGGIAEPASKVERKKEKSLRREGREMREQTTRRPGRIRGGTLPSLEDD